MCVCTPAVMPPPKDLLYASVCVCLMFGLRSLALSRSVLTVSAIVVVVAMSLGAYLHVLLYLLGALPV